MALFLRFSLSSPTGHSLVRLCPYGIWCQVNDGSYLCVRVADPPLSDVASPTERDRGDYNCTLAHMWVSVMCCVGGHKALDKLRSYIATGAVQEHRILSYPMVLPP